ncbi:hypothetical protein GCM10007390_23360 [Persicitalea jodogahamensis]|uniref:Uncharacterized protein n=1 Tax=Persicitalea jodogahamensis TaxID=402147 RepID=A0A8J3D8N8_9BACT|nr:hypothetical protein GCM10007390_23360 [Persicitalea jodogahamensis]
MNCLGYPSKYNLNNSQKEARFFAEPGFGVHCIQPYYTVLSFVDTPPEAFNQKGDDAAGSGILSLTWGKDKKCF